jgi:flavin-dependent dehydrogenase
MQARNDEADVVVIGAGPQGLMYAAWVKQLQPRRRVVVLDRAPFPGHKIGESTLSGFCRAARSVGIRHEAMQRLFFPKNGLGFFFAEGEANDVTSAPEYIVETFDETFQVERRMLDGLLMANAERLGVEVIRGARVDVKASTFSARGNTLAYTRDAVQRELKARIVADASGPASVLGHHFGGYTTEGPPFQTSSVWAYFKNVKWLDDYTGWKNKAEFPRDQYTEHICFKEGWFWYIPIVSWQAGKPDDLYAMLRYLADPASPSLSRDELSTRFNCPYEQIWSIGISVRDDRDPAMQHGPSAVFEHYGRTVPMIAKVLEGAEILHSHYDKHDPYARRLRYRRHAKQPVGDGWLLVGDAAFFIDPLRSPGLTGGVAAGFVAAQETIKALEAGAYDRAAFATYEAFVRELHEMLEEQNQIAYMAFNHPEAIEIARRLGEVSSRQHFAVVANDAYTMADTNVWGHLSPAHRKRQRMVWSIMREEEIEVARTVPIAEQSSKHYERMVRRLREAVGEHLDRHLQWTPFAARNLRPYGSPELPRIMPQLTASGPASPGKAAPHRPGVRVSERDGVAAHAAMGM